MRLIKPIRTIFFLFSLLMPLLVGFSQTDKADSLATVAIEVSDITIQAEKTEIHLKEISVSIEETAVLKNIREQYPEFKKTIASRKDAIKIEEVNAKNTRQLTNYGLEWKKYKEESDTWQNELSKAANGIQLIKSEIELLKEKWENTRVLALEQKAPKVVTRRVGVILKQITESSNSARKQMEKYLVLNEKIGKSKNEVERFLESIDSLLKKQEDSILSFSSPPLWEVPLFLAPIVLESENEYSFWEQEWRLIETFILSNFESMIFIFLAWGLILFFFLKNRKQLSVISSSDKKELDIRVATSFLARPFASSLLFLLFIILVAYTNMPLFMKNGLLLIMVLALFRLVPEFISEKVKIPFYVLMGLYIFIRLNEMVQDIIIIDRRYLLLFASIIAGVAFWFFSKRKIYNTEKKDVNSQEDEKISNYRKFITFIVQLSILAFGFSTLANLFGSPRIAQLLTLGIINSTIMFVIIYVITLLATGFLTVVIRRRSAQAFKSVKKRTAQIEKFFTKIIQLTGWFIWLYATLNLFKIREPVIEWFSDFMNASATFGSSQISVESILLFILIIILTFVFTRLIKLLLEEDLLASIKLPRGVAGAISMITRYTIVGLGITFALVVAGFDLSSLTFLAGAMGVGIGFGLQNIIANFISGLILAFERPIQTGDKVTVGTNMGVIKEIGVRSSKLRTYSGEEVIIPNSDLISKEVTNWTYSDNLRRQEIFIKTALNSDPHVVMAMLEKACTDHLLVLEDPLPSIFYQGYSEYSQDYRVLFWTYTENGLRAKSDVALNAHDALIAAGIGMPIKLSNIRIEDLSRDQLPETGKKGRGKLKK